MLSAWALLFGALLLALTLAEKPLRRLPLAPAVIYLGVGCATGVISGTPLTVDGDYLEKHAHWLVLVTELAVMVSLLAVGLRLRVPPTLAAWSPALALAGPGMLLTVLLGMLGAVALLGLPWPAALLLAAILAPTDPVLASEVQIRSDIDRDAVRTALTAEGGLNDGSALPMVMLGLGWMGLHTLGPYGLRWAMLDVVWAIGGGVLLGVALGRGVGAVLRWRSAAGDPLLRDELIYIGLVMAAFGLAQSTATSTFVVAFVAGATLLLPFRKPAQTAGDAPAVVPEGRQLAQRLDEFGARVERVMEAATVLAVGWALYAVRPGWSALGFGLLLALAVRPLAAWCVLQKQPLLRSQRRLVAWFGIRGTGTLYYIAFAIEQGVADDLAAELVQASLAAVAVSIVLHGISATPLMSAYQRRREALKPTRRDP